MFVNLVLCTETPTTQPNHYTIHTSITTRTLKEKLAAYTMASLLNPVIGIASSAKGDERPRRTASGRVVTTITPSTTIRIEHEYRLKKIVVHRSDAIDQIKFEYDDETQYYCGHDAGTADPRELILTEGEYVVKVAHERFDNIYSAGAAVCFTTNKGRIFGYYPSRMATKHAEEITTLEATPGHEIIRLVIRGGILEAIVEQAVPPGEAAIVHPKEWYTIVKHNPKKFDNTSGNHYEHFHDWTKAKAAWRTVGHSNGTALLIDSISSSVVYSMGKDTNSLMSAMKGAVAAGYCAPNAEEDVSIYAAVKTLLKILTDRDDIFNFCAVTFLLLFSALCELKAKMLSGKVLTMFNQNNVTDIIDDSDIMNYTCSWNILSCNSVFNTQRSMIIAYVAIKMLSCIVEGANVYIHHNACEAKNVKMSKQAFKKIMNLDQTFFDKHSVPEIRAGLNVESLSGLISWNIPYIITKSIKMVMTAYFLFKINTSLTLLALISLFTMKFGVLDVASYYQNSTRKIRRKLTVKANQVQDDSFYMISAIKMFSSEARHIQDFNDAQHRILNSLNWLVMVRCFREFGYNILKDAAYGGVLYYGLILAATSGMKSSDLVSFVMIYIDIQQLFQSFKWHYEMLKQQLPDIDRYIRLMAAESVVVDGSEKLPSNIDGSIEFKDVWFEYPGRPGEPALRGLNLKIKPNAMTAIVGESGAGKSTISRMIMRLYDPSRGSVLVDGHDLRNLNVNDLHKRMSIVNQSPDLFAASIGENIAYGAVGTFKSNKELMSKVVEFAKLGNCYDFIMKLRGGFDTFVGSRGGQLSGGQRQRIAIARAAIRDPKILILDEATSALDAESEKLVQDALEKIMENRTTVVIAHRLSTIRNADDIVCMREGKVAEQGSHEELMAMKGVYYNLINKQVVNERKPSQQIM